MNDNNILEEFGKASKEKPDKGQFFRQWDGTVQKYNGEYWDIIETSDQASH